MIKELRAIHGEFEELKLPLKGRRVSRQRNASTIEESSFPIDFVVTWVDGNDPNWLMQKKQFLPEDSYEANLTCRYRDWELLKYWFRMVEEHAPWVNKVYFVTWGHYPEWLNLNCSKLVLVRHEDYMPAEYLPTFSSIPIELNLHRIKGLSEHFVYFNDDMFLTRDVRPSDFFSEGMPKYAAIAVPLCNYGDKSIFQHQLFTNLGIINKYFNVRESIAENKEKWFSYIYGDDFRYNYQAYKDNYLSGLWFTHLLCPYRKIAFEKVWKTIPERMDWTCRHRFREPLDVMHQIFQLWEIMEGSFIPVPRGYYGGTSYANICEESIKEAISNTRLSVCLNDAEIISDKEFELLKTVGTKLFENRYPKKSCFEK